MNINSNFHQQLFLPGSLSPFYFPAVNQRRQNTTPKKTGEVNKEKAQEGFKTLLPLSTRMTFNIYTAPPLPILASGTARLNEVT